MASTLVIPRHAVADPAPATSPPPASAAAPSSAPVSAAGLPPLLDPVPLKRDPFFKVDPVTDVVLIGASLGFAGLDELILSTGEIAPQRPGSTADLLGIDRVAVTQTIDPNANTRSNIGLGVALAFAAIDPVISGFTDGLDAGLIDGILFAESLSVTFAITDLTKIAFRRPRPIAYQEQAALNAQFGGADKAPSISDTDATLSFFSGHASIVSATAATATYLAFMRSPGTWRPWVTLAVGALWTAGVSYERVRAGAHFPTDVIAGSLAGASIGVLVPHIHRFDAGTHHILVGGAPAPGGGGLATVSGTF
jgi:membrane-associated phospholipid phosphatase